MSKMIVYNKKYESRTIFNLKNFLEDFINGVSHRWSFLVLRLDGNCLKTYPGHMALLIDNFL